MKRVHSSSFAAVLAVTTSAWAGGGPYPVDTGYGRQSSETRAQVIAELQEAQRLGLVSASEGDFRYLGTVVGDADSGATREESRLLRVKIRAETAEAGRLGLLSFGENGPPVATAEQAELIATAGRNAVHGSQTTAQAAVR